MDEQIKLPKYNGHIIGKDSYFVNLDKILPMGSGNGIVGLLLIQAVILI